MKIQFQLKPANFTELCGYVAEAEDEDEPCDFLQYEYEEAKKQIKDIEKSGVLSLDSGEFLQDYSSVYKSIEKCPWKILEIDEKTFNKISQYFDTNQFVEDCMNDYTIYEVLGQELYTQ